MAGGAQYPPVTCFFDGETYWLADGYLRYAAALDADHDTVAADVRIGTRRDAMLFAVGANVAHGLRLTSADKRRAVERLLADAEWSRWSDCEIARRCGVSDKTVAKLRKSRLGNSESTSRRFVSKHGTIGYRPAGAGRARRRRRDEREVDAGSREGDAPPRAPDPQAVIDELEFSLENALGQGEDLGWLEAGQRADVLDLLRRMLARFECSCGRADEGRA